MKQHQQPSTPPTMSAEEIKDIRTTSFGNYQDTYTGEASADGWMRNVLLAELVLELKESNRQMQIMAYALTILVKR